MNDRHRTIRTASISLAIAGLLLAAGCAATQQPTSPELNPGYLPDEAATPNSGLAALAGPSANPNENEVFSPGPQALDDADASASTVRVERTTPAIEAQAPVEAVAIEEAAPVEPPPPVLTTEEQIALKAAELRGLLAQRTTKESPLNKSLTLAALDAFIVGDAKTPAVTSGLSPAEADVAKATRELFNRLQAESSASADALAMAGILTSTADGLSAKAPVRISDARLCTKVESFGRFDPFLSNAFLAGRQHRVIVYVELDRFASRTATSSESELAKSGNWVVELSQELELIHDADGRQQWYRPAQTVLDASRSRRRDFYLVNTIELPPTLSVGAYSLKVILRDKTTGSVDERVIPIQVIADGSALESPRSVTKR